MELGGLATFFVFFLTLAGIYAVMSLGLNVQWGFSGQFNIGIAGFWAVGSYTAAILSTNASPFHLGGFGLPFAVGLVVAAVLSGLLALLIGLLCVNLRTDYLAIATIGIGEIVRLVLKNEDWLTNGVRGIPGIPRPFAAYGRDLQQLLFLAVVLLTVLVVYLALERANRAPWGRVQRAIRENEPATLAAGKNVLRFRLEAFVLGSAIMGVGGALYAHFVGFISPEAFDPLFATFIVWVMLIAGGSGNNRGAVLGAFLIWAVWSGTQFLTAYLPADLTVRAGALRVLLVGVLLQVILLIRPEGLLREVPPKPVAPPAAEMPRGGGESERTRG
ncbi:MAG TPA: branched-chain amino acid ABC transporter permease [Geminicoccaceae bacterium]|nr:branched-chain amino acid ABC transporter permease [Geminicoccaceae bacterium]